MEIINGLYSEPVKVYVKNDTDGNITAINSEIFIDDFTGWIKIDSGHGDKFAHAQNHYLEKSLLNKNGEYNYKLIDGRPVMKQ
ncbi:MAG: hypothetical protein J1F04_02200 [Oscillospiraceae bacterium]|nr:hypothetical protein [Oscillospiraceae bacterium]